jgi:hypothetical protein
LAGKRNFPLLREEKEWDCYEKAWGLVIKKISSLKEHQ